MIDINHIKYIVTDLDGTLLNSSRAVSDYTIEVFKKIQFLGIRIILASGRDIKSVSQIGKLLNMSEYKNSCYICLNGLQLFDYKGDVLFEEKRLDYDDAKMIYEIGKKLGFNILFCFESKQILIICEEKPLNVYKSVTKNSIKINEFDDIPYDYFSKIKKIVLFQESSFVEKTMKDLEKSIGQRYEISKVEKEWLEINPKNISKGHALKKFAKIYNIALDNVLVFGNGENDIEMIKSVKYGIATKNAFDIVKESAYEICDSHEKDGVAKYIEMLMRL